MRRSPHRSWALRTWPADRGILVGSAVPRPWPASSLTVNAERVLGRDGFMATSPSSAFPLDHAIRALTRSGSVSPQAASAALSEAAEELGVEMGDLAALVLASEQQQLEQRPPCTGDEPDREPRPALFVVGEEPLATRSVFKQQPAGGANSWAVRDPKRLGSPSWSHTPNRVAVSTPTRPSSTRASDADRSASTGDLNDDPDRQGPPAGAWSESDPGLTSREAEIVMLLTHGLSNQQIADHSFLSINSVKTYIRSAYRKIGVQTRSQALLWGMDHDLRVHRAGRTWERVVPPELGGSARAEGGQ